MKVFLDTNVFAEYIFERDQFKSVQRIFQAIENKEIEAITSSASIYTLTYLSEQMLKRKGIHRPELTEQVRKIIFSILQLVHIGNLEQSDMISGVNDTSFSDIEDCFQYQCALKNQCSYLISINIKDFPNASTSIETITPIEFVGKITLSLHQ